MVGQRKDVMPYFQPGLLPEILTIQKLWQGIILLRLLIGTFPISDTRKYECIRE